MLKNVFLLAYRSMLKNRTFLLINIFGMGIAIGCCIVSWFAWEYNTGFDSVNKNGSHIYRVGALREFNGKTDRFSYSPVPLGEIALKEIKDVDGSSRYAVSGSYFKKNSDLFNANLTYVDPEFPEMFTFHFIAGSNHALKDQTSVVISESIAIRLFSSAQQAYGKTITQVIGNKLKELRIAGVFQDPVANSSFYSSHGSAYLNFENYADEFSVQSERDWHTENTLFIKLKDNGRLNGVRSQLQKYRASNNAVRDDFQLTEFTLDQFSSMAINDRDNNINASTWGAPPLSAIVGSMIMSGMILLIACFNLTNTAIAMSSRRLKEIGIRKVMGSVRIQLIVQFIGETTLVCLLALIVGIGMADLLTEGWNTMTSNNIHLIPHYLDTPGFLFFMIGILLVTGLLAGSYPAFYISKFQPVTILKGKLTLGGTNYFTRTLLALQFAISLITIVSSVGFFQNAEWQRRFDLGFDSRGTIVTQISNKGEFTTYQNALRTNPAIEAIAGARRGIFSNPLHEPVKFQSLQSEVDIIEVGDQYGKAMGLRLVAGRDFRKDSETDRKESVIITQRMADLFKLDQPLGKELIWKDSIRLYVVGIVKNVYTHGLWREMEPMMIRYVPEDDYRQLIVSTNVDKLAETNEFMRAQWNIVFPNQLYNGELLNASQRQVNALGMSIVYGYGFLGLVALLLSGTGLYTLVSLNLIRRTKEIGIRKICGASVSSISRSVNSEFIVILMVAAVAGSWLGYAWCNTIMSTIWKYYQGVNFLTFVVAVGILFIISFATIAGKVFHAASMNPVNSLKEQ